MKTHSTLMMRALEENLSGDEAREFEHMLENNPELRTRYEKLRHLGQTMQASAADSFGPGFADRVMEQLGAQRAERFPAVGDMLASLFARVAPVALGLAAIVGAYNVTTSTAEDQSAIEAALGLPDVSVSSAWESALASYETYPDEYEHTVDK